MNDVLSVVEAAYRIDRSEPHWLSGIADVARSQFQGCLGAACFTYDINDAGRMEMPSIAWRGDVPGVDAIGLRLVDDGVVRQHRLGQLRVDQLADAMANRFGGMRFTRARGGDRRRKELE